MKRASRWTFFLGLAVIAGVAAAAPGAATTVSARVGGDSINIPAPTGFFDTKASAPQFTAMVERGAPPRQRLLATFLTADDLRQASAGAMPEMHQTISVYAASSSESSVVSDEAFQDRKSVV